MVEPDSKCTGEISTYTCDSCGRVATSVRADKLSHCCKKTTLLAVETATEVQIPKSVFGTDFIAVVCRGKVVDILLLSDRTSVHTTLHDCQFDGPVQGFVDNPQPVGESREATDIEVRYENNVYVVRIVDGAPHIMIPAMEYRAGDSYLTSDEKQSILALARSTLSKGIIENASGHECGSGAQCSSTRTIGDESVGAAVERRAAHGIAAEAAVRAADAGLRNTLKQLRVVAKRIFELVLRHKTPSLLKQEGINARETAAALTTEHDKPGVQAEDAISSAPHARVQTQGPPLIPEVPKRNINFSQHPYHQIALAFGYTYQSQVSSKIDYFLYTHPVGHTLEFAKLPAEAGAWKHVKTGPNWKHETGCDHASLITYLLACHDLKTITDSTPAANFLASPSEVAQ